MPNQQTNKQLHTQSRSRKNAISPADTGICPFVEAEISLLISQELAICYHAKPVIHSTLSPCS